MRSGAPRAILAAMFRRPLFFASLGICALALAYGCASTEEDVVGDINAGQADGGEEDVSTGGPIIPGEEEDSGEEPIDVGDGGKDGGGDGGTVPACPPANNCASATELEGVSGDTGADVRETSSRASKWFKVPVVDKITIFNPIESVTIELESPPGTNFDLYAYLPPDAETDACKGVTPRKSTKTSGKDSVSLDWEDVSGSSDTREVVIEVRHVSGTCPAPENWKLKVTGNTL